MQIIVQIDLIHERYTGWRWNVIHKTTGFSITTQWDVSLWIVD